MIIYKDFATGDELISDSFDLKEVDGVAYEVECRTIKVGGDTVDVGGNPSAEGGGDDEGVDDAVETKLDVPAAMRLESYGTMDKKEYSSKLRGYFKAIKEKMKKDGKSEDEIKDFEKKAQPYAKKLLDRIKDIDFYIGEGGIQTVTDDEGKEKEAPQMYIPFYFAEGATEPTACFWKHGLDEMKV